ncbi:ATP-dependent zinc metalloprotease FtsH [Proteocatella sphenisci]|uniref:ATP-dependent zinc metalloprotease FtsH n=1 Tax=Proteocatella sphenisci TaxID=181070 RepID=UPI00048C9BE8|nr:ATP-dependent zinc metalloprotease FtsH [Proteocatella sphenisci]
MKKLFKGATFYILLFVLIVSMINLLGSPAQEVQELSFSEFYTKLQSEQITELTIMENKVTGKLKKDNTEFSTLVPYAINNDKLTEIILTQTETGALKVTGQDPPQPSWIISMLPTLLMLLVMVGVWYMFMQQSQGGGSKVMGFGKSKAKIHKEDGSPKIAFKDVAGLDEEKEELEEIVDFLKSPQKYIELGARIPKGVLLVGPPGTGKTYLSKAVAGEAGVPFYSISGSDFVEMFVGVGASRVRDLFEQAKKSAPSIIFIDEIDAVGRRRGAGLGGGHDEREQTLNQLLVEMDGFGLNEGVIIMAATNRPDILDPALLRPGRFDRQVMVGSPDVKGREAILKVHSKNKPLAEDVDLKHIAKGTPGFTPADLENLMNEAALLTVRKRRLKINNQTIEEAITKVIAGVAKTSRVISPKERKLTAYHEAGHAVVATMLPYTDPVHQVTIVPRGKAGGFTMILPEEDRYYMTKTELKEHMVHLLGGRVSEKLILGDISTGASNDLERVAQIARGMVTKYAMSDRLGAMAFVDPSEEVFLGKDFATKRNYSEEVASIIDEEIKILVDEAYQTTLKLLEENTDKLHLVAQALLKYETLDAKNYLKAFNGELDLSENEIDLNGEETQKTLEDSESLENKSETETADANANAEEEKTEKNPEE